MDTGPDSVLGVQLGWQSAHGSSAVLQVVTRETQRGDYTPRPALAFLSHAISPALTVRARGGTPPYSWLLNGAPVAVGQPLPVAELPAEPGFSALAVIDAEGRSARAGFRALPPAE